MTAWRWAQVVGAVALLGLVAFGVSQGLERIFAPPATLTEAPAQPGAEAASVGHITATLFYATPDGQAITGVRREVPLASGPVAQGRAILIAQMEAAPEGYLSAIPPGTSLRGFYITSRQDAFVDLSPEASTAHPGGSSAELLTVYTLVNAVITNLPSVQRVQILIDGKEVDTLAGHIDLRRPLEQDLTLVRDSSSEP
jgi:hypothetical protein